MTQSSGAGYLDRLLQGGSGAVRVSENGVALPAAVDKLNIVGDVTVAYEAPAAGQNYGTAVLTVASAVGPVGLPGSRWYPTTGAPTFTGVFLDRALDIADGNVYVCFADGVHWSLEGSLKGADGASTMGWYSSKNLAGEAITPGDYVAARVSTNVGIEILWDAATQTAYLQTNFAAPAGPTPNWSAAVNSAGDPITPGNFYPVHIGANRGIEFGWDSTTNSLYIGTNFQPPSYELNFTGWSSKVTIASADTSKLVSMYSLTEPSRLGQRWAIEIEAEIIVMRTSTTDTIGRLTDHILFNVLYDADGVMHVGAISANPSHETREQANELGLPSFTGVVIEQIDNNTAIAKIGVSASKLAGGNDTYARCRIRKSTELQLDNW